MKNPDPLSPAALRELLRAFGVAAIVFSLCVFPACRSQPPEPDVPETRTVREDGTIVAEKLLELEAETLAGGKFRLADVFETHRAVLLYQWASWCSGCVQELPLLSSLAEKYADRVRVVTVVGGEPIENTRKAAQAKQFDLPVLLFSEHLALGAHFPPKARYRGVPFFALVAENGDLLYLYKGELQGINPAPLDALRRAVEGVRPKRTE